MTETTSPLPPSADVGSASDTLMIGARDEALLAAWLPRAGGRPILIEPDPEQAEALRRRDGLCVIEALPGAAPGSAELSLYNLPGLRSAQPPAAALGAIYPGLRVLATHTVRTEPLETLLAQADPLADTLRIHVDMPGSERIILESMAWAGLIPKITLLRLRCPIEPMFEGGLDRAGLLTLLADHGLTLKDEDDADPDWPFLTFEVSPAEREARQLRRRLAETEHVLSEARKTAEAERMAAQAARKEATEALKAAKADQEKTAGKLSEARDRIQELQTTRDATAKALKAAKADREQTAAELTQARSRIQDLQTAQGGLSQKIERLQEDLSIALRMQTMLQNDLSNLQMRYLRVDEQRQSQQDLLAKLTPRLQQARLYLQTLPDMEEALLRRAETEPATLAPTAEKPSKSSKRKEATSGKRAKSATRHGGTDS